MAGEGFWRTTLAGTPVYVDPAADAGDVPIANGAGGYSWAPPAGGGGGGSSILDVAKVHRAVSGSTTYSTAWADIVEDSVTLEVSFTTSTSGLVVVDLSYDGSGTNGPRFRLYDTAAAAAVAGTYNRAIFTSVNYGFVRWLVPLSASTGYTIRPQIRGAAGNVLVYSGPGTADADMGAIVCTVQAV